MRQLAQMARWRGAPGFSTAEVAVVAIIVCVLMGLLLQRIVNYQRQAELLAVENLAAILRGALVVKTGALLAQGRQSEIALLTQQNPVDWLTRKPHNYLGVYYSPAIDELPAGSWYYDMTTKTLVYLLNNGKSFPTGIPSTMKFKVKLLHSSPDSAEAKRILSVTSVSLVQVET